tara:strand:+ start:224 stop:1444 length:1221 start_codon:yes stop_codon:yes gene_type:complete
MADNIGTVTVAIEAQTEELTKGLKSAERAVNNAAKKMEQESANLASKAEKSWTEFASKMGVIQQVGAIAQQVWNGLDGVLNAVTDSTANASQKMSGAMDAIEAAGIPVLSQFMAIGRGIGGWISGEKQLRREIDARTAATERAAKKELEAYNERRKHRLELSEMTDALMQAMLEEAEMASQTNDRNKLRLKQERERVALLEAFEAKTKEANKNRTQEAIDAEKERFDKAFELFRQNQRRELEAFDQAAVDKADAEIRENNRANAAKKKADEEAAKARLEKTMSLQTKLDIMLAKQSGDEEKARTLAIEARYEAMKKGATEAQLAIINQMQAIELAGKSTAKTSSEGGGGSVTASVSTALGSFTIARRGVDLQTKQVSLLQRIAQAQEKVADKLTNTTSSQTVTIPS